MLLVDRMSDGLLGGLTLDGLLAGRMTDGLLAGRLVHGLLAGRTTVGLLADCRALLPFPVGAPPIPLSTLT